MCGGGAERAGGPRGRAQLGSGRSWRAEAALRAGATHMDPWVGNRPRGPRGSGLGRCPLPPRQAPQPPSQMAATTYLQVRSTFREDPWVTLGHKDSRLGHGVPPPPATQHSGTRGLGPFIPPHGQCGALRTETTCPWEWVAPGPTPCLSQVRLATGCHVGPGLGPCLENAWESPWVWLGALGTGEPRHQCLARPQRSSGVPCPVLTGAPGGPGGPGRPGSPEGPWVGGEGYDIR